MHKIMIRRELIIIVSIFLIINYSKVNAQNLIPAKPPGRLYNYFCTWGAQNYLYGWGKDAVNLDSVISNNNAGGLMNERLLTGNDGWLNFYKRVHGDLIFLFDEGYNTKEKDAMEIDPAKFPSFNGTPQERQKKISRLHCKSRLGWIRIVVSRH